MTTPRIEEMVEEFASIEHERWSKWQKYMHSKMIIADMPDGERFAMLPIKFFERWERQINTSYKDLLEEEKQSDREQVYPYIKALTQAYQAGVDEAVKIVKKQTRYNMESDGACSDPECCGYPAYDMWESDDGEYLKRDDTIKALQDKK